jgi:hypothetical protein
MKNKSPFCLCIQRASIFLFACILLALDPQNAIASPPRDTNPDDTFMVSVSQFKNPICVGDTVNVSVKWSPNSTKPSPGEDGLGSLTPLAGPFKIKFKASHGTFIPEEIDPGLRVSGTDSVAYTADKEGEEQVFAMAYTSTGMDGLDSTKFTIKKCNFYYTLVTMGTLTVDVEEGSYTVDYTMKSSGLLKAEDSDHPLYVEGKGKKIKLDALVTSFSVPKCTLFTYEPGTGEGTVDVRGYPNPNGTGMVVDFAPPNLAWNENLSFSCDGDSRTVAGVYPVQGKADPWLAATFPLGSGEQDVKPDMFEIPKQKLQGPGAYFSYRATITLEKEPPK